MFGWGRLTGIAAALLVAGCGGGGDPAVVSGPPREAASAGGVWASLGGAEALTLYVASAYDRPSSASRLGGNYTLSARFGSTMLNVNSDGEGFGMYDHAWRCTVNGRFSVIDARFNPYRAEWTFSACNVPASRRYEGVAFTGFA